MAAEHVANTKAQPILPAAGKLVVVLGMTASGKSRAAMQMAQQYDGEIICADSRTLYKGLDIGTAKPTIADRKLIPHHLLDVLAPNEHCNVAEYQAMAQAAIADVLSRGKLPILVGGTGLYIDAVIYDYDFNKKQPGRQQLRPNTLVLGFWVPDEVLRKRIAERVERMFMQGLQAEVQKLSSQYGWNNEAMKGIGYREWRPYFSGLQDLETTKEQIIRNTWQYARRQRTWFRRSQDIHWYSGLEQPSVTISA